MLVGLGVGFCVGLFEQFSGFAGLLSLFLQKFHMRRDKARCGIQSKGIVMTVDPCGYLDFRVSHQLLGNPDINTGVLRIESSFLL